MTVRVFAIQDRTDRGVPSPYVVRWQVGTQRKSKSFAFKTPADQYRSRLITAHSQGERFDERTGEPPEAITHVFLTDLRPDRRRGLSLFPEAEWLVGEAERDAYRAALRDKMVELDDDEESPGSPPGGGPSFCACSASSMLRSVAENGRRFSKPRSRSVAGNVARFSKPRSSCTGS